MKTIAFKAVYFALLLLIFTSISNSQIKSDKVKAAVSNMPDQMKIGETVVVTVTITNNGTTAWSNASLVTKETGEFEFSRNTKASWVLEPGQSREILYNVTAPVKPGKYKMRVVVYNDSKKIGSKSKMVNVVE